MKTVLFLDSSALVKLYIEEPGQDATIEAVQAASSVVVSALALPEAASAFFRRAETGVITKAQANEALNALHGDWTDLERVALDDAVATEAAVLARAKGLKGADAVQLATAALLSRERRGVRLMAFDQGLLNAATSMVKVWGQN